MAQDPRYQQGGLPQEQQSRQGWLSFTALFSDGDRLRERATPAVSPSPEAAQRRIAEEYHEQDAASNADDHAALGHFEELSDMRLDISDIQEAIKNHDLWVQDAVAMRHDIDDLQAAIREHEGWMANLSGVVKQIQAKEAFLEKEVADLRQQVGLDRKAVSDGLDADSAGPLLLQNRPYVDGQSEDVAALSERGGNSINGYGGDEPEMQRLVFSLNKQLNSGLRSLRTMVTAVEGSLLRQIDSERSSRRASVQELRQEISRLDQRQAESSTSSYSVASHAAPASVASGLGSLDAAIGALRSTVDSLEHRTSDKSAEVERMVLELRTELAALRTEQQLQAVAAGALALTQGNHSQHRALPPERVLGAEATQPRTRFLTVAGDGAAKGDRAFLPPGGDGSFAYDADKGDSKRAVSAPPAEYPPQRGSRQTPPLRGQRELRKVVAGHPARHPLASLSSSRDGLSGIGSRDGNSFPSSRDGLATSWEGWPPDRPDESKGVLTQGTMLWGSNDRRPPFTDGNHSSN